MTGTINIPIHLIRGFKRDKNSLEMLACSIIIKSKHQNSCLYDLKVTSIMETFRVSHKKAKKLLVSMKEHELFIYNSERDCLYAKSFKSQDERCYGKKKQFAAKADYCRKLRVSEEVKLQELVKQLRETLILCVIHASEQDNFIVDGKFNLNHVTKPNARRAIPQRKIGEAIGLSRSSACRYTNKLIDKGDVKKGDLIGDCVIHVLNEQTLCEYRRRHPNDGLFAWYDERSGSWSAWKIYGYEYNVQNRDVSESFKNVIYNYKYPNSIEHETSSELDGDAYWAKHS